ncbi:hypothetical protein JCM21714_798 [Gracilibacillus boraciitolerans JCM 21714]|uniref:DUF6884 domain-containing protein n=1 Tax=Gracilibacillus boraciitolerans JCM 21714 TaxID=1298598 RepID=W4VGE3_9BACI|nr:DUF6884 domain-containing protein [Gracilibacillus boraciitolerans]GAE91839.1 hypothetical protein JCM21714_798 [Gracilibacillus boraciitolerans JCM 21714]
MTQLCIIPCGKKKIWDKYPDASSTKAKNAYIGIFHHLCQQYVQKYFDKWIIISGKHGILLPDDIVPENYDVTFRPNDPNVISLQKLQMQIKNKDLEYFSDIVVLTGKKYRPIINSSFAHATSIQYPLLGTKGIGGDMQHLLKKSITNNIPLHKRKED